MSEAIRLMRSRFNAARLRKRPTTACGPLRSSGSTSRRSKSRRNDSSSKGPTVVHNRGGSSPGTISAIPAVV